MRRGCYGGAFERPEDGAGGHGGSTVVNVSLTLFQCSPGNEAERLLTVMKSRSPKVHRRRMHFRRSSRLSALAVRPGEKNKREKKKERGRRPHNGGMGKWRIGIQFRAKLYQAAAAVCTRA